MYGSPYGSYSSISAPMDITPSHSYSRPQDASCAFPSWPRRASLSSGSDSTYERATSYLSDDDLLLFPSESESDYHSDTQSVSSSSSTPSNNRHPEDHHHHLRPFQQPQVDVAAEMQRERAAYQREVMRFLALEKESRRNAAVAASAAKKVAKPRSGSSSSSSKKGSPKSKLAAMTPIAEAE
ncbi:hypothetical protein GE09DRAFT_53172 [Coniochaeta sp. 2T2.1]|nr:hypothetical protein GE09DRAFT_53172 [Coniochaeta sp. 2T2.1]